MGKLAGVLVRGGMSSEGQELAKEEKREIRVIFYRLLGEAGVSKQGLEDLWNFVHPPKKKPIGAPQAAAMCLASADYVAESAVSIITSHLNQLRKDFREEDKEWERFVLYVSQGFAKYNKKIRSEFLSLLGSQGMRQLFLEDYPKFNQSKQILFEKYEEAYVNWWHAYQDSLRKDMDKNLFADDLARPLNSYHLNSLPLEFVHPRDLAELDLPEPKKTRAYRFPLSGF